MKFKAENLRITIEPCFGQNSYMCGVYYVSKECEYSLAFSVMPCAMMSILLDSKFQQNLSTALSEIQTKVEQHDSEI